MAFGVISEELVRNLSEVISLLLLQSEQWNLKGLYPDFYKDGQYLVSYLETHRTLEKEIFEKSNNWIGAYCNAFDEFDLAKEDLPLYSLLMNYSTQVPWVLAYDNDDISTYVIGQV